MNTVKQRTTIKYIMLKFSNVLVLSAMISIALVNNAIGQSLTDHEDIENKIHNYIKTQLTPSPYNKTEIIISQIDRRKQLASCQKPLALNIVGKRGIQRTNTINVSCVGSWRIFVPVTIKTLSPIVTAKKNLALGELLNSSNMAVTYLDTSLIIGQTVAEIKEVLGAKVKRYIQNGRPILSNLVCMVCKNEQVAITVTKGSLKIRSSGVSLSDGSKGQKISIKNNSSGRIIEAVVVAVGRAEIKL